MPVTTLPNPLANHLKGDAKKCDRIEARVTRLEFPALLTTDNTILDRSQVSPLKFFHLLPMSSFKGEPPFVADVERIRRTGD